MQVPGQRVSGPLLLGLLYDYPLDDGKREASRRTRQRSCDRQQIGRSNESNIPTAEQRSRDCQVFLIVLVNAISGSF